MVMRDGRFLSMRGGVSAGSAVSLTLMRTRPASGESPGATCPCGGGHAASSCCCSESRLAEASRPAPPPNDARAPRPRSSPGCPRAQPPAEASAGGTGVGAAACVNTARLESALRAPPEKATYPSCTPHMSTGMNCFVCSSACPTFLACRKGRAGQRRGARRVVTGRE